MIKVHIADDHKMVVEGFCDVITKSEIASVCGISHRLSNCRRQIAVEQPDVLLLDIEMPDGSGIDFFVEIKQKYPTMKIIALTTHDEYSVIKNLVDNGISGYVLKSACSAEIIEAIETVVDGKTFLCDDTNSILNTRMKIPQASLTSRELVLLELLLKGLDNKEAAIRMCITVSTVESYRKSIKSKLNARSALHMGKIGYQRRKLFFDDNEE